MTVAGAGPSGMAQAHDDQSAVNAEKALCYCVTAHRPSAVLDSVVCNLTGPDDTNLIISKCTRLEIHKVVDGGTVGLADVPIYGRIETLQVVKPLGRSTAALMCFTTTHQYFILEWDMHHSRLNTVCTGDTREKVARPCERGTHTTVSADSTVVAVHQYDGILRILRLDPKTAIVQPSGTFMARVDEIAIVRMCFLNNTVDGMPVLAVLHEDYRTKVRSLKSYTVSVETSELHDHSLRISNVDPGAAFLIPVDPGLGSGVIVVGESSMVYAGGSKPSAGASSSNSTHGAQITETFSKNTFLAWGQIDDTRALLADFHGTLHLLTVVHVGAGNVTGLELRPLGSITFASCISYLDDGKVFVGSQVANSQIVQLLKEGTGDPPTFVQVMQEFTNLGPILDFAVVDLDNIGQGQLIACCNTGCFGSLRLVRNGIGITEHASITLEGIRGAWSVKGSTMAEYDQCLVITFVESTHVLSMNASEELDEANISGFVTDRMTLFCGSLDHDHTVQVTAEEVRLLDITAGSVVATWQCPEGRSIAKVASTGASHLLVATGQGHLYLLECSLSGLTCTASTELNVDIACIDLAGWEEPGGVRLAAVGTWTRKLLVLSLPTMKITAEESFGSQDLPRSMLFMALGGRNILLLGMGDGHVAHWQVDDNHSLKSKKVVSLGVKPVALSAFRMNGCPYVFAALDRPAVVHEHNGKLVFSPLNESNLTHLCTFSTEAFPGAIAMCKDDRLMITAIDAIQRLHIRTIPLREQARRITYQKSTKTFGILTLSAAQDSSAFKVLSQSSWDVVAALQLQQEELGTAICSCVHPEKPDVEYYVLGTGLVKPEEPEPKIGRILVLQLTALPSNMFDLRVLMEQAVNGAVYSVVPMPDCPGKLAVTVNSQVCVFEIDPADAGNVLKLKCKTKTQVVGLYAAVQNRKILVGDLMKSVGLYQYNEEQESLMHIAKEYDARWCTAVAAISDTIYASTDNNNNLTMLRYNHDAPDDHAKQMMETVVEYHLGDMVNRVQPGNLVMQLPDAELGKCPVYIMCTILGMISLCILLPEHRFKQLMALQNEMVSHIKGVGGLLHSAWRSCASNEPRSDMLPAKNCLDGDLIEQVLDMQRSEVQAMVDRIPEAERLPVDDLIKLVEDLQRMK